jgi:hypothetical protein
MDTTETKKISHKGTKNTKKELCVFAGDLEKNRKNNG